MPSNPDSQNSGRFSRPIDPPSLPPWSTRNSAEAEDTPTLSGDAFEEAPPGDETQWVQVPKHPAPSSDGEDPRDLARRLAEEAKKRLAQTHAAKEQPVKEDPRELAKRLAAEAKARVQMTQPLPRQGEAAPEDPRDLARRLAEEAKRRLATTPPVATPTPQRRASYTPPPLAERAAARPLSASEALARARKAEKTPAPAAARPAAAPKAKAKAKATPPPPPQPAPAPYDATTAPTPRPAPTATAPKPKGAADAFLAQLPGATVTNAAPLGNPDVFRALWRAHRARALHEKDLALVATASVLLDAVDRIAPGRLVAARVQIHGQTYGAWMDLERSTLLGLAQPADVYLAGT